jgi:hypothetical protein
MNFRRHPGTGRRDFLKAGSLGSLGVLGIHLSQFLRAASMTGAKANSLDDQTGEPVSGRL